MARSGSVRVVAPGRVNLIGEHTDYSLFPVLPMAIQRRVVVEADPGDDGIVTAMSTMFAGAFSSAAQHDPGWAVYLRSALAVIGPHPGARLSIGGDLPATGGLSSSSALTVAVILALLRLDGREPTGARLIALAVAAERDVGVEGGTMDQTVIVRAEADSALRIDFLPSRVTRVPVPEGVVFIACASGRRAAKGTTERDAYNARVVGCRTAAGLLGLDPPVLGSYRGSVADAVTALPEHAEPPDGARELSGSRFEGAGALPVRAWTRHVLSEARRVDAAQDALRAGDVAALGALFDASHRSLRDDMGVSTREIEETVAAARAAGASAARLTGAGFGGWVVAVTTKDRADVVLENLAARHAAFRVIPSAGAG